MCMYIAAVIFIPSSSSKPLSYLALWLFATMALAHAKRGEVVSSKTFETVRRLKAVGFETFESCTKES